MSCSRMPYCFASTTIERPSGVSSASDASWATSARSASLTPSMGTNSVASRLPSVIVPVLSSSSTSTSPDASTARPESASTLRRTSRSMPAIPIADSSAPIVVGISETSSAIRVVDRHVRVRELCERPQRHDDRQEHERQPREQDVERDLVRGLAAVGALDELDHAVEEAAPRLLGDLDHDPVREHPRAAGDRAAVAAGLADHGRGLAGDRRLVDRRDALDHGAVARDQLARLDHDDVAAAQLGRPLGGAVTQARLGLGAHRAQRVGLRAPAALGERLGQIREHDRQPEPDRDGEREPGRLVPAAERLSAEDLDQPRDRRDRRRPPRPRT